MPHVAGRHLWQQLTSAVAPFPLPSALLAGISSVSNVIKSYQLRTGKPKEVGYVRSD
jgi:hypothetical protein